MIIKSLLLFGFLFISYSVFISNYKTNSASQNQNQDNLIKAQNYLFELKETPKNVIVGTSLSCHIKTVSLSDFYNLAFNGSSIYDGLDIVLKRKKKPKCIYIEINYFLKNRSELFSSQLDSPFSFWIGENFKVLRWDSQPLGKFIRNFDALGDKVVKKHRVLMEKVRYKLTKEKSKDVNNVNIDQLIKLQKEIYLVKPNFFELKQSIIRLKQRLKYFKKYNVDIVFFEMPVNYSFLELPYSKAVRSVFYSDIFKKYKFIEVDTTFDYITSDGIHLTENESKKFTNYFKNQLHYIN